MTRDKKIATTVTEEEKQEFRLLAAEHGMNMSQYLRELVYDDLEANGTETSREKDDTSS